MEKEKAFEIAQKIAKELETALYNGDLDEKLKEVTHEDWDIYIAYGKATLDAAYKSEPERAMTVGSIFNGIVQRRIKLISTGE